MSLSSASRCSASSRNSSCRALCCFFRFYFFPCRAVHSDPLSAPGRGGQRSLPSSSPFHHPSHKTLLYLCCVIAVLSYVCYIMLYCSIQCIMYYIMIYIYIYTYIHTYTHTSLSLYTYMYIYICIYVYMYIYIYIYIYIYTP